MSSQMWNLRILRNDCIWNPREQNLTVGDKKQISGCVTAGGAEADAGGPQGVLWVMKTFSILIVVGVTQGTNL